jgi:hypothetical protein
MLDQIVGAGYRIFGKMRLSDIIDTGGENAGDKRTNSDGKIEQKWVDFVICRADDLMPVAVVELTGTHLNRLYPMEREDYLAKALSQAGIRLIRFASPTNCSFQEVRDILAETLSLVPDGYNDSKPQQIPSTRQNAPDIQERTPAVIFRVSSEDPTLKCPSCGEKLVMLTSSKGINRGKRFWACTAFPKCTTVIPICQTDRYDSFQQKLEFMEKP